jgi:hypothetical protein
MRRLYPAIFAALALTAPPAFAIGEQHGQITGIVYDQNGATLPGVRLTLAGAALLGGPRIIDSDGEGAFAFTNLPPGKYDLLVERPGLKALDKKDIVVAHGKTASLYLVMELPTSAETVTVTAERPVVDTTNMTQGGSFSTDIVSDATIMGRSYQDSASMLPGVVAPKGLFGRKKRAAKSGGALIPKDKDAVVVVAEPPPALGKAGPLAAPAAPSARRPEWRRSTSLGFVVALRGGATIRR